MSACEEAGDFALLFLFKLDLLGDRVAYPSHGFSDLRHRLHAGFASSHLTWRFLNREVSMKWARSSHWELACLRGHVSDQLHNHCGT